VFVQGIAHCELTPSHFHALTPIYPHGTHCLKICTPSRIMRKQL